MNLSSITISRITKELIEIKEPEIQVEGIKAIPTEDFWVCDASISGPPDTPYEGGLFNLKVTFPQNYPYSPPTIKFTTYIYHPNIDQDGNINLDVLTQAEYSQSLTLQKLLLSIQSLLTDPDLSCPLDSEIAQIYINNKEQYNLNIKQSTKFHAFDNTPLY